LATILEYPFPSLAVGSSPITGYPEVTARQIPNKAKPSAATRRSIVNWRYQASVLIDIGPPVMVYRWAPFSSM